MGILKPDIDDCSTLPAVLEPSQHAGKRRAREWRESEDRVKRGSNKRGATEKKTMRH